MDEFIYRVNITKKEYKKTLKLLDLYKDNTNNVTKQRLNAVEEFDKIFDSFDTLDNPLNPASFDSKDKIFIYHLLGKTANHTKAINSNVKRIYYKSPVFKSRIESYNKYVEKEDKKFDYLKYKLLKLFYENLYLDESCIMQYILELAKIDAVINNLFLNKSVMLLNFFEFQKQHVQFLTDMDENLLEYAANFYNTDFETTNNNEIKMKKTFTKIEDPKFYSYDELVEINKNITFYASKTPITRKFIHVKNNDIIEKNENEENNDFIPIKRVRSESSLDDMDRIKIVKTKHDTYKHIKRSRSEAFLITSDEDDNDDDYNNTNDIKKLKKKTNSLNDMSMAIYIERKNVNNKRDKSLASLSSNDAKKRIKIKIEISDDDLDDDDDDTTLNDVSNISSDNDF